MGSVRKKAAKKTGARKRASSKKQSAAARRTKKAAKKQSLSPAQQIRQNIRQIAKRRRTKKRLTFVPGFF